MYSKETISVNSNNKHQYAGVNTPVFTSTANRYNGASEEEFLNNLQLIIPALSLGGVETTVCQPSMSSHASLTVEERLEQGITDALLRLSVGIENADDLIKDIEAALKA